YTIIRTLSYFIIPDDFNVMIEELMSLLN
ncbi:hypothetical protein MRGR3_1818, partial [Staphylococcus aureus subsp. aureus MRGR3]